MIPAACLIVAAMTRQHTPPPALAHQVYFQAALLASVRPASGVPIHRIDVNLGGSTGAVSLVGGVMLSRSIGLEGEFVYGGTVAAHQHFSYTTSYDYTAENQQRLLNALVRFRPSGRSPLELLGGGGYGRSIDRQTSVIVIDDFFRSSAQRDWSSGRNALTLSAGADVRIRIAAHAALVPEFRVRWIKPLPQGSETNGIGAWAFESGAGVRIY